MKFKIFLIPLFALAMNCALFGAAPPSDKARGMFISFGVGPRIPIFSFAEKCMLGYGFNVQIDYTDNELLPYFVYGKIGFEQYPGAQSFYQNSDYSNYSATLLPLTLGARHYFSPLMENIVLVIPMIEVETHLTLYQKLHQFKRDSGLPNYLDEGSFFGFSAGVGASMFLMEITAHYNFYPGNSYVSMDLKVRLPLYVEI